MTHPHTPSCIAGVSWAKEAPLGASSSASLHTFSSWPSPSPSFTLSAGIEADGESPVWAVDRDEVSFLSLRQQEGRWADKEEKVSAVVSDTEQVSDANRTRQVCL